jgi:hypothetical protein
VGARLELLVAHKGHRIPGSILLLLVRVLLLLLLLLRLLLMLRLMKLLLLKLRLMMLLVLGISRLRSHLLIAMATIGLPMARRLLAPVVHGRICPSVPLYSLFHPPLFYNRSHLLVTAVIVDSNRP